MTGQALYRFFDEANHLLYVGITLNPAARLTAHQADKAWWTEVARITIEEHLTRDAVLRAERDAIRQERPRYNVMHNRPTMAGTGEACDLEDCDEPVVARGLCRLHYTRWRKHGDPMTVLPRGAATGGSTTHDHCAIEECNNGPFARGWCKVHYTRWYKHGDPMIVLPRGPRPRSWRATGVA